MYTLFLKSGSLTINKLLKKTVATLQQQLFLVRLEPFQIQPLIETIPKRKEANISPKTKRKTIPLSIQYLACSPSARKCQERGVEASVEGSTIVRNGVYPRGTKD